MKVATLTAIQERESVPPTAEEIEAFATRIAALVARTPIIDMLCDEITALLEGAERNRTP